MHNQNSINFSQQIPYPYTIYVYGYYLCIYLQTEKSYTVALIAIFLRYRIWRNVGVGTSRSFYWNSKSPLTMRDARICVSRFTNWTDKYQIAEEKSAIWWGRNFNDTHGSRALPGARRQFWPINVELPNSPTGVQKAEYRLISRIDVCI